MKRSYILIFALWGGLFISGCDPTETTMFNVDITYPPTTNVVVFRDTLPSQPYDEIGHIDNSKSIENMVKAAKAHGADGLIDIEKYSQLRIMTHTHTDLNGELYSDEFLRSVMIKFKPTQ